MVKEEHYQSSLVTEDLQKLIDKPPIRLPENHLRLIHIIREQLESQLSPEEVLSQPFTWHDIDFIEGEEIVNNCEQLIVTVKGVEIPLELINLKAQLTMLGKINLNIFIDERFQKQGIGTKIYISFIHQFGGIYSGFGRIMNKEAILTIYKKLDKEPDIKVDYLKSNTGKPIGIQAVLDNKKGAN